MQPGDVYGFRMTGKNADSDARLNGTLTLDVVDYTQLKITPKVTGTLGANGWYTSDVTVGWQITYPADYPLKSACLPRTVRADTAGASFGCSVRLPGGDAIRESVTIKRDTTPPVVTFTGPDAIDSSTLRYRQFEASTYEITVSDALSGLLPSYGSAVAALHRDQLGRRAVLAPTSRPRSSPHRGTGTCMTFDAAGNHALQPIQVV